MSQTNIAYSAAPETTFALWSKNKQVQVEQVLTHALNKRALRDESHAAQLQSAMQYSALGGGKRIRALLCYAAAELCGTDSRVVDASAAAVEMIHAYSLVHDDMPCMDDDDMRRGKPSCHKQYDDATALLVGDALQSKAFYMLSQPNITDNKSLQVHLLHTLARASGIVGMAGGQAIDLESVGKPLTQSQLEAMHKLKTGALIQAAVEMGAGIDDRPKINAVIEFSQHIGLAFQVIDDILDVEADSSTLGKTAGKDAESNKPTYVTLLGLDAAKAHAQKLYDAAITALHPFGEEAKRLRNLADLITQRSF